jgi:Flp pilus assembly protein TadG
MAIVKAPQRRRALPRKAGIGTRGTVAVEFALVAPVIILIAAGVVDFGLLEINNAALLGATRIGAQYALLHPADTAGIQRVIEASTELSLPLSVSSSSALTCECADGSSIDCSRACATTGLPGPNRVFVTVSASQAFTPLVPWPGLPTALTATVALRVR